jgi:hypothetical protein
MTIACDLHRELAFRVLRFDIETAFSLNTLHLMLMTSDLKRRVGFKSNLYGNIMTFLMQVGVQ